METNPRKNRQETNPLRHPVAKSSNQGHFNQICPIISFHISNIFTYCKKIHIQPNGQKSQNFPLARRENDPQKFPLGQLELGNQ
jgi:hypothetical protein